VYKVREVWPTIGRKQGSVGYEKHKDSRGFLLGLFDFRTPFSLSIGFRNRNVCLCKLGV